MPYKMTTLKMTTKFSSFSNSLLIGPKAVESTLLFGLNTGVAFSLTLNFAFAYIHVPKTFCKKKKTSENFLFNSVLNFSISVILLMVTLFTWRGVHVMYWLKRWAAKS